MQFWIFCVFAVWVNFYYFLSSIYEKANCITMFWTVCPHSLGSCYVRGVWATCLSHKGGDVPLSALFKDTKTNLLVCSLQHPLNAERQAGKL